MKNFVEHLSQYAEYHRDKRNILTHLFGVPVIVFSVIVLLSRPQFDLFGWSLTPVMLLMPLAWLFYLRLNLIFALLLGGFMLACMKLAGMVAAQSLALWLSMGIGLFVGGWVVQFIGHYYEGKKPAFVDDLVGLLVGPMFVLAELLFMLGLYKELQKEIEKRAGLVTTSAMKNA